MMFLHFLESKLEKPVNNIMSAILVILFVLTTTGCLDYGLSTVEGGPETDTAVNEEIDTGLPPEDDTDSGEDTGDEPIDTDDPVDPSDCDGYVINEGFDRFENTQSRLIYSNIGSATEIEVRQGDVASFPFAVTADRCGDVVFNGLTVVLGTIDDQPADWVTDVEYSNEPSVLTNTSGSAGFQDIDGYNCNGCGYDSELFFWWTSEVDSPNAQGEMDEVCMNAGSTEIFEFGLVPTEFIPVGTSFDLFLIDPEWIDVETGADVWDTYYYLSEESADLVMVTVTIVE